MLAATGDPQEAARLLGRALDAFEELPVPFEAARTKEDLAPLSGPGEAGHLESALDIYERLGARPYVEQVVASIQGIEHDQAGAP